MDVVDVSSPLRAVISPVPNCAWNALMMGSSNGACATGGEGDGGGLGGGLMWPTTVKTPLFPDARVPDWAVSEPINLLTHPFGTLPAVVPSLQSAVGAGGIFFVLLIHPGSRAAIVYF